MGAVAKGGISRMAATAEGDCRASPQAELLAILIHDREVALYANRSIAENGDFCASQGFLRLQIEFLFETSATIAAAS